MMKKIILLLCCISLSQLILIHAAAELTSSVSNQEIAQKKTDAQQKTIQALEGILPPELHASIMSYLDPLYFITTRFTVPLADQTKKTISKIAISPDGKFVAYAIGAIIHVLQYVDNILKPIFSSDADKFMGKYKIESLAFSVDSKSLVAAFSGGIISYIYQEGQFRYNQTLSFSLISTDMRSDNKVLFFERDGVKYVVLFSYSGMIIFKQKPDLAFEIVQKLNIFAEGVSAGSISNDGNIMVYGNESGDIVVYEINSTEKNLMYKKFHAINGFHDKIKALTVIDARHIAATDGNSVKIWELKTNKFELIEEIARKNVSYIRFSKDGSLLCMVDGYGANKYSITIWEKNSENKFKRMQLIPSQYEPIIDAFIPDTSYIIGHITPLHSDINDPAKIYIWRNEHMALRLALFGNATQ